MSNGKIRSYIKSDNSLYPKLKCNNSIVRVEFRGVCLKQDKVTFNSSNVINLFVTSELYRWSQDLNADFTLKYCLLGAVKLTKNTYPDIYFYARYGIRFDSCSLFYI